MSDNAEQLRKELESTRNLVNEDFDNKFWVDEVCLSVKAQMLIQGITLPFFLILVGPPSSFKTTILSIVGALPDSLIVDMFTPRAFVSNAANKAEETLRKQDLLPRMNGKTLITAELGPFLSARDDELRSAIGILTRILDGKGFRTESGVHGSRGYDEDHYFTWLGATPKVSRVVMRTISDLGPKVYFLRIRGKQVTDEEKLKQLLSSQDQKSYNERLEEAKQQQKKFWQTLTSGMKEKIVWDASKDDSKTVAKIASLAILISKMRVSISWTKIFEQSQLEVSTPEDPKRAFDCLYNLTCGHAVLYGRNYITEEDLWVAILVALSSAYADRSDVMVSLLQNNGILNTEQIMQTMKVSRQTAINVMTELEAVDLVTKVQQEAATKPYSAIKLNQSFAWLLSEEYAKLWRLS